MIAALTPETARLVRVDWEDIYFADNWSEGDDENDVQPVESTTVGYLLQETPTMVVIGSSYDWKRGQWGTVHAISKAGPRVADIAVIGGAE